MRKETFGRLGRVNREAQAVRRASRTKGVAQSSRFADMDAQPMWHEESSRS